MEAEKMEETIEEKKNKPKWVGILIETIIWICVALVCMFVVPKYVMQRTVVSGQSMENTLHNKENLIVEKVSRYFKDYNRFDIVIFYPEHLEIGEEEEYYVKRIIGLPGETVQIIGEDIYINGEILEENYGKESIDWAGLAEEPMELGKDEYFVLGDNRRESLDSRFEKVGIVHESSIAGKAVLRIWPLNKFGIIK